MKDINNEIMNIEDKDLYVRESFRGWAIVIMPNDIKIDNYHGFAHIHFKSGGIHIPIMYNSVEIIKAIIRFHIIRYRDIKKDILIKILIGDFL